MNLCKQFCLTLLITLVSLPSSAKIVPADVLAGTQKLNRTADHILQAQKLKLALQPTPLFANIRPAVVFQLHVAIIELLHHYELALKLRPIPIVTSSPIVYIPADVKYLNDMINTEMHKITQHLQLKQPVQPIPKKTKAEPSQVFTSAMQFYQKLLALSGTKHIGNNQNFTQYHRIRMELEDIIKWQASKQQDVKVKRRLIASLFGSDPYSGDQAVTKTGSMPEQAQRLAQLINPKWKITKLKTTPDAAMFMLSQLMLADLGDWKRKQGFSLSTPITAQVSGKTAQDVAGEIAQCNFLLQQLHRLDLW